jgi:AcrR family transcriptional regulator
MARTSDKAELRRREILENFYEVLKEEGLEGASIAKIAARMDIHPSLIIHYFSTKEELIVALVDSILEKYEETFLPALQDIEDPEERLEATIDAIFGMDWARLVDAGVFYACYSLSFRNQRVKDSFQKMYSRLRELLIEGITVLIDRKIIIAADAGKLADLVITLLEGYDFYRGVMEDDERFDELSRFLKQNALAIMKT